MNYLTNFQKIKQKIVHLLVAKFFATCNMAATPEPLSFAPCDVVRSVS